MVHVITTQLTTSGIKDIYITENDRFAYVVTSGGVDVIELINTCAVVASGKLPSEPTTITANWKEATGQLYIGTIASGIFVMDYHRSRKGDFTDKLVQRFTTTSIPPVSSNDIRDLDALPGRLMIGTGAGVDFISNDTEYSTRPLVSGSNDVHLTAGGAGYWTTVSGNRGEVEVNYDLISTTGTSIIDVDFEYSLSSNPPLPYEPPTDIAISERDGFAPVLAFATPSGALVTEEIQFNESTARRNTFLAEEVTSVDFGDQAAFDIETVYVLTSGSLGLRIFDLETSALSGTHPQRNQNIPFRVRAERGQFVASGTNTIVRTTTLA